jgi:glycosyltransferase involved in cell wall biosynthesis
MESQLIALLGRPDAPTDGVADYCGFLAQAFERRSVSLKLVRVPWAESGWADSLRWLARESAAWKEGRVLLQYTAMGWSRRGFPVGAVRVLSVLRRRGVPCTVVFHDSAISSGNRMRDRARRATQRWTLRRLSRQAGHSVFTCPTERLAWLRPGVSGAAFIPIGANVPECRTHRVFDTSRQPKQVVVFSVTEGDAGALEAADIASAVRHAEQHAGPILLDVLGRGAMEAKPRLEELLRGSRVQLQVRGVIPAEEISRALVAADVSLCVRGETASNRGTSIAGIACGVPVVGYGTPGTDAAIDAAGVKLAPLRDPAALASALAEVLTDAKLWQRLHERNLQAQEQYFSWDAVATRYLDLHARNRNRAA